MDIDYDTLRDASDDDFEVESEIATEDELNEELERLEESEEERSVPKSFEEELAENDYLKIIENKLQQGQLDDYTFMLEKLMIDYKQALKHRRFKIDNEQDLSKIERIRVLKSDLQQELVEEKIDEMDFTRKYYNLLRLEYDLLLKYEDYTLKLPSKITASTALVFKNFGLFSFDYSRRDYSSIKFKPQNDIHFSNLNQEIIQRLEDVNTYRFGTEILADRLSFRAGYMIEDSPYNSSAVSEFENIDDSTNGFSLGFGYKLNDTVIDLSFVKINSSKYKRLYDTGLTNQINIEQ